MTENLTYKPIGGVAEAELWVVGGLTSVEELRDGTGLRVDLADDGSLYEESIETEGRPVSVRHTLTLCSDPNRARAWFDSRLLDHAAIEGLAARITLATGERLTLGWSERFGFEQALRLRSLHFSSGAKPNASPTVKLVLEARDTRSTIGL